MTERMEDSPDRQWPPKYNILGIDVSATTYEAASDLIISAAKQNKAAIVTALPVHGIVVASRDPSLKTKINSFDLVAPDGQPVRWYLNMHYNTKLSDRIYGPELMLRLCRQAAEEEIGVYLYGTLPHIIENLRTNLISQFPSLQIVGWESPPFRPLTPDEDKKVIKRINDSGARLIFLGLGCPKQDLFAYEHKNSIKGVQICVGAAFDFHSGNKKMAPGWMQRNGLEWLYRLVHEPNRLWRRYLFTNTVFLAKGFLQIILHRNFKFLSNK